jgi:L-lactate permease
MYGRTLHLVRYSLLTISCMLALGFVTRYSGTDAAWAWHSQRPVGSIRSLARSSGGWALH